MLRILLRCDYLSVLPKLKEKLEKSGFLPVEDGEDAAVKGQHYKYPHAYPGSWVAQQYLPDALVGTQYYHWGENKTEQAAKAYWQRVKGQQGSDEES